MLVWCTVSALKCLYVVEVSHEHCGFHSILFRQHDFCDVGKSAKACSFEIMICDRDNVFFILVLYLGFFVY